MSFKEAIFLLLLAAAAAQAGFIYGTWVRTEHPVVPILEKIGSNKN